jgi:hypothetical protein
VVSGELIRGRELGAGVVDVRASIEEALRNRAAQRPSIDKINAAWRELAESVDVVLAAAGSLDGDWRLSDFQHLRTELMSGTPGMGAMTARFHRDTVNIGVIGRTRAGKSTLLRTITGLGTDVMPSRRDKPSTAVRSRIQHVTDPAQKSARITLYTWPEFRDRYLALLHRDAGCEDPVPATPEDFLKYGYRRLLRPSQGGGIYQQQFLERLCVAQDSFGSYRQYLLGAERTLTMKDISRLTPFVAYPEGEGKDRPYHAVRDVWIYCPFQVGGVERLVLVDLPGAGEAGLDIDSQFLTDLQNQVDLLMQVKLPALAQAFIGEDDWRDLRLADDAAMGVDPKDFLAFVINTYPDELDPESVASTADDARRITERNGVQLYVGNVDDPADVRDNILGPVLERLALRLAAMDGKAAQKQIGPALDVAQRVIELTGQGVSEADRQRRLIPDESEALRREANKLRSAVGNRMDALRTDYARRAQAQERIQELTVAIGNARERLLKWADTGFGNKGGRKQWLTEVANRLSVDQGETWDDECTLARERIRAEFGQIDSDIVAAIDRLHSAVAVELSRGLSTHLVPAGDRPLDALRETARARGRQTLYSALNELIEIRVGYGSVFLRVGGPIVTHLRPQRAGMEGGSAPAWVPGRPADGAGESLFDYAKRAGSALGSLHGAASAASAAHPAAAAAAAVAEAAAAAAPLVADLLARLRIHPADGSAAALESELGRAFREAVSQIEELMQAEAGHLTQVLAAAADQFFDSFFCSPDVQEDWAALCDPVRRELWPTTFGSQSADLAAGLDRIADAMAQAGRAAAEIYAGAGELGIRHERA